MPQGHFRIPRLELVRKSPVESGGLAVQKSGFRQQKYTGADAGHMGAAFLVVPKPIGQLRVLFENLNQCQAVRNLAGGPNF